ncbi:MAG: hypothetical protein WAN46_15665 [Gammaproteobacteria bacterium]
MVDITSKLTSKNVAGLDLAEVPFPKRSLNEAIAEHGGKQRQQYQSKS